MFPYNQMPPTSSITSSVGKILIDEQSRVSTRSDVTRSDGGSDVASEAARMEMVFGGGNHGDRKSAGGGGITASSPLTNMRQNAQNNNNRESAKSRTSVTFAEDGIQEEIISGNHDNGEEAVDEQGDRGSGNKRKKITKKRSSDNIDEQMVDMQTEIGSNFDIYSDEEEGDDFLDDSGNEADIDTISDGLTLPSASRMADHVPTREEMQREFARKLSERLVQSAMLAGAKDNITAMVILLPGCGLTY